MEVYSIDEAFLDLTGVCQDGPIAYGQKIRQTVRRATGIPVCVGLGPTKTLAKLANFAAKKWPKTEGVLDLSDPIRRERLMRIVPVGRCGVLVPKPPPSLTSSASTRFWTWPHAPASACRRSATSWWPGQRWNSTALPVRNWKPSPPTNRSSVHAALAGSCKPTQRFPPPWPNFPAVPPKSSGGSTTTGYITIFIRTNPFNPQEPQYQRSAGIRLDTATQDTRVMIATANRLLKGIFRLGYHYQKCGVQLGDIQPAAKPTQGELFDFAPNHLPQENPPLMQAMDQINRRFPESHQLCRKRF